MLSTSDRIILFIIHVLFGAGGWWSQVSQHRTSASTGLFRYRTAPRWLLVLCGVPDTRNGINTIHAIYQLGWATALGVGALISLFFPINPTLIRPVFTVAFLGPMCLAVLVEVLLHTLQLLVRMFQWVRSRSLDSRDRDWIVRSPFTLLSPSRYRRTPSPPTPRSVARKGTPPLK